METIKVEYIPDNKIIEAENGLSILQISLKNNIPHTHICFGEAQCSTCRVEILEGIENLPPRNDLEKAMAKKNGWTDTVRLACQTIPNGNIKIRRLILDDYDAQIAQLERSNLPQGKLEEIAIFFLDIKDFTIFSEKELPYDVIFTLNRYYNQIGDIILSFDGYIDKYIGDSLMAIFGIIQNKPTIEFCLDAVYCSLKILEITEKFNEYLQTNFNETFHIRMGLAYGKAVLGMIGHRHKPQYTAIGSVVNLASRLESANKKTNSIILISDSLYQLLQNQIEVHKKYKLRLKGFSKPEIAYSLKSINGTAKEKRDKIFEEKFLQIYQTQNETVNQTSLVENYNNDNNLHLTNSHIKIEVDKQHSQILFQISHLTSMITGIVKDFQYEFYLDKQEFKNSKLKLIIPVKSITTFVDARDQHLYSGDFFDADNFPNIIFIGNDFQEIGMNQYNVYGNLFIRGITKKIVLFLEKKSEEVDPFQNKKICFSGNTTINRNDFNINYNIPLTNNNFLIGQMVKIIFEFQCMIPD